jgi:hypothetical protein
MAQPPRGLASPLPAQPKKAVAKPSGPAVRPKRRKDPAQDAAAATTWEANMLRQMREFDDSWNVRLQELVVFGTRLQRKNEELRAERDAALAQLASYGYPRWHAKLVAAVAQQIMANRLAAQQRLAELPQLCASFKRWLDTTRWPVGTASQQELVDCLSSLYGGEQGHARTPIEVLNMVAAYREWGRTTASVLDEQPTDDDGML